MRRCFICAVQPVLDVSCDASDRSVLPCICLKGPEGLGYYKDSPPALAAVAARPSAPTKPKIILSNNSIIKGLGPSGVVKRRKPGAALRLAGSWCTATACSWRYIVTAAAALLPPEAATFRRLCSSVDLQLTPWSLAAFVKQRTPRSQLICGKWKPGRGKHARMMTHGVRWSSDACLGLLLEFRAMCSLPTGAIIKAGFMQARGQNS